MAKDPAPKLASGDTAYLYRAAIGPRGQDYYLRHFARFDGEGRAGSSWNWAAYWTTFNWLVYRRMWGWALAYVAALMGLALLVFGVGKLVFNYSDTSAVLLSLFLLAAAFVVPGLYANAWFYTHCNEKISAVLRTSPEVKDAATVLANQAPDNRRLLLLGVANAVLLALVLATVNSLQNSESALPQLASREERALAGGQSGQVGELATAPTEPTPVVTASAPAARIADGAPAATPAPAPAVAAAPEMPQPALAASVSAASAPVRPGANGKPAMINASDRGTTPAKPEPATPVPARTGPATPVAAAAPSAPTPAPATASRPAKAAPASTLRYVWVIQVGAYAQDGNAQKALADVLGLGLEAGAESFESPQGKLMRVRVGPFVRQAEAEQAALRIKTLNLPTLVIRQRP